MSSPITPIEDVAEQAGISEEDVGRYKNIEGAYGTGILPPAVWAQEMGHPSPVGMPRRVTWMYYAENRE